MRADQSTLKDTVKYGGSEQMAEASIPSKKGNVNKGFLDTTALIRSIQRAEGNPDCFLKGQADCDQIDCAWRPYCLGRKGKVEKGEP